MTFSLYNLSKNETRILKSTSIIVLDLSNPLKPISICFVNWEYQHLKEKHLQLFHLTK